MITTPVLLGLWLSWFLLASLPVYATSESARFELAGSIYTIAPTATGRVTQSALVLGRTVAQGEVLLQLDDAAESLLLDEARARLTSLRSQVARTRAELSAQASSDQDGLSTQKSAVEEARSLLREAELQAQFADEERQRSERLLAQGLIPDVDANRTRLEAVTRRAAADRLSIALRRQASEQSSERTGQLRDRERLRRDVATLDGSIGVEEARIKSLLHELDRRSIRAPLSGRIADVADIRIGSLVSSGDRLATIVPEGNVAVVAHLLPHLAVGRVRPGQRARVRLHGFSWTEFGSMPAEVTSVASEVTDGLIRVELSLLSVSPASRIPVQHGMPGSVEIEIRRASPAQLVLQAAGVSLSSASRRK